MKILVKCRGYIGDILFASSLAKKLKEKYSGCHITYEIPLEQPRLLLQKNPYIDHVYHVNDNRTLQMRAYDMTIDIPEVDQNYPATMYFQASAGIEDQSTEFDVYTLPEYDEQAKAQVAGMREDDAEPDTVKVVAYQMAWAWKAYQCTKESLTMGVGAPHRDIEGILDVLFDKYIMVPVGFRKEVDSKDPAAQNADLYAQTASLIKHCDWFIGSEGGLSNLAAAVGTKCIITTDFIYQNYGPNGRVRKCEFPMMGPQIYYPDAGHVHLDPCLTDEQVLNQIIYNIDNG